MSADYVVRLKMLKKELYNKFHKLFRQQGIQRQCQLESTTLLHLRVHQLHRETHRSHQTESNDQQICHRASIHS